MTYKLLKDGEVVNTVVGSAAFVTAYCEDMGYTFEEVPDEQQEAPVDELAAAVERGMIL